jgi:archaeal flagellar protein FlaI
MINNTNNNNNQISRIQDYPFVEINFFPKIPLLNKIKDKTKVDVRYCLIYPFTFVHIYWNQKEYELSYDIEEPELNKFENEIREKIIYAMRNIINFDSIIEKDVKKIMQYIDQRFKFLSIELGYNISYESYKKIFYYLCRDFIGFNEVEPLLRDFYVEDIECNGVNTPIYVVHRIYRNIKTNVIFNNDEDLTNFVEKLSQKSGKYVSYAEPILDGSLPDGSRVNATYTRDITSRGPTFTIRKFTKVPWTPVKLLSFQTLSPEMLAYMWLLVQYKMSILIAGGTSSGKTTLLNALAFFIPPESRVVSIEDTREINLSRENWLPSVARVSTGMEKTGEIDLFTLLRSSFRQNPDYVIVGEVRGKEAYVLFQGMASGHPSISTLHADSVDTVIKRLETPPIELSPTLLNILDCVCVMAHALVKKQETRKLREITEIVNVTNEGVAVTNTPYIWNSSDNNFYFKKESKIFKKISDRYGISLEELNLEFKKRVKLIYNIYNKGIFKFEEVQKLIHEYYKKPEEILKKFNVIK